MMVTRSRSWLSVCVGMVGTVACPADGPNAGFDDTPRGEGMVIAGVLGSDVLGTTVRLSVLMQIRGKGKPLVPRRDGGFLGLLDS